MSDPHGGGAEEGDDMDRLIAAMEQMEPPEGQEKKTFEEKLEDIQKHPAFMQEIDPSQPLTPEMEGLMRLKYESENPVGKAEAYKDDGNHEFQKKQYRIAVDNYTEGIKCNCPDKLLNAILYTNRAAANFRLGNFRSSFNDCIFARKFKPDHMKAINKGAECCLEMKKYEDCIKWCDGALIIDPKNKFIVESRNTASKQQKAIERDKRKEAIAEKKAKTEELKLIQAIQGRGITLAGMKQLPDGTNLADPSLLRSIEVTIDNNKVHLDNNNIVYWPVMFLYPEHTQTDYIKVFCENHRLIDHLNHMFGCEVEPPPWDPDKTYKPHTINIYFEDKENEKLHKVNKESTLLKVLQHKKYMVYGGTPSFIIIVAGSDFERSFLKKYES